MRIAVWTTVRRVSGLALAIGAMAAGAPVAFAEGGTLYKWETADGTIAFTDDPKRIPEKYQTNAETIDRTKLTSYGRYTATDAAANEDQAKRLAERLATLRASAAAEEDALVEADEPSAAPAPVTTTHRDDRRRLVTRADGTSYWRYSSDRTTKIAHGASLPVDPNDPNPVVTEQRRVRVPGEAVTQTITVTRQGDRVLSVVKQRPRVHSIDFEELSDFE
jgi:hypothetical protein